MILWFMIIDVHKKSMTMKRYPEGTCWGWSQKICTVYESGWGYYVKTKQSSNELNLKRRKESGNIGPTKWYAHEQKRENMHIT